MSGEDSAPAPQSPAAKPRVVVIGSGFGGSVSALRLCQSGRFDVTLLERGHRYEPGDFPRLRLPDTITSNPEWAYNGKLPDATRFLWRMDRGLWDLRNLGGLQTLQAAGLGGGSLVYAAVHYRAPNSVFRSWPVHRCSHADCTACSSRAMDGTLLAQYYAKVEQALGVSLSTEPHPKSVQFEKAARRLGRESEPVPLAIHFPGSAPPEGKRVGAACTGCGQCITGCSDGGKNTLDRTYLALAEEAGLRVRTLCEATSIQAAHPTAPALPETEPPARYHVHFRDHFLGTKGGSVPADYVFLCAGAVHSTELLAHSVACNHLDASVGLKQLGKRFWANGDAFAVAFDTEEAWEPGIGPTITRAVGHVQPKSSANLDEGASLADVAAQEDNPDWFLIQNGGLSPNLIPALSLLNSPALLARNTYAALSRERSPSSDRWSWLSRAARSNATPNVQGLLAGLPRDLKFWLPKGQTYRSAVLEFLAAQLMLIRAEFTPKKSTWGQGLLQCLALGLFTGNAKLLDQFRTGLGKHPLWGALFDAPHSVALLAQLAEQYLLGPRPNANTAVFLAMGADAEWELEYRSNAFHRLTARTKDKERIARLYRIEERVMRDFARAAGGDLRTNPGFSVGKRPITVHGQGGCIMGNSRETSVVDPTGEVWEHPGLFVLDGSILPSSVGVNPSHTIAALAELNVAHFLERTKNMPLAAEGLPPLPAARVAESRPAPSVKHTTPSPRVQPQAPGGLRAPDSEPVPATPNVRYVPVVTKPTSLTWSERMFGFVAAPLHPTWAEPDLHLAGKLEPDVYQEQYQAAVFRGRALDLRLEATIPDLDVFVGLAAPLVNIAGTAKLHTPNVSPDVDVYSVSGSLTLRFDSAALGAQADAPPSSRNANGNAVLQTPTMFYDLLLEPSTRRRAHSGGPSGEEPRRLLGTKLLVDDPGIDAWQDLTTLYTDVVDESGRVCFSGVVRVGLLEFLRVQLPSFSVDKDGSAGLSAPQKAMALGLFLKRFFGDLAQLYDARGVL